MIEARQGHTDYRFAIGLLTGACIGVGLALWLAPRPVSELAERVTASVDRLTNRGLDIRDEIAATVAPGAHEVERVATTAMNTRTGPRI
jgi:gas vesicle protein